MVALGSGSAALGKAHAARAHLTPIAGANPAMVAVRPAAVTAHVPAKTRTMAHAAGHKIA